jgi:hypothetical protein
MDMAKSALERAFQLAASGGFSNVGQIKVRLSAEGYYASQVEGPQLSKQLVAVLTKARKIL